MCVEGMGGSTPPQLPPSGGATSAATPAPAGATTAGAATTGAVAGAAGAGAATLAGGPPGSLGAILQQLTSAIQAVVAAIGGGTPPVGGVGSATPVLAGGPPTVRAFETASRSAVSFQLPASLAGSNVIQVLDQIVAQRKVRVGQLQTAIQADASKFGTVNQLDQQQVIQEQRLTEHIAGLAEKFRPIAATIDQNEGAALLQEVQRANGTAALSLGEVDKLIVQIQGGAKGLPAQFIASGVRFGDTYSRFEGEYMRQVERVTSAANATGAVDQTALAQVSAYQNKLEQLNAAFKRVYDGAGSNPAAAQAKVDAANQQTTVEGALQALA